MQWSLKKTFLIPIGHVVGCGGINFAENKTIGKISWDIIHPDFQGKSRRPTSPHRNSCVKERPVLKTIPGIQKITVRTLQVAYKFYEK